MNIFVLLFKFNYQTCLSQLASGNFNWNISVTILKLGYICNFGLISQYLTFTSDFCEKLVYSKYSTRLLRWYDRIFFFYLKIVFDFIEPFHLPLKPFLRKSKSLLGLTHFFPMVINHSQPLKSRILYSLSNKHPLYGWRFQPLLEQMFPKPM